MYTSLLQRERRGEERVQAMCSMSEGMSQCMWECTCEGEGRRECYPNDPPFASKRPLLPR